MPWICELVYDCGVFEQLGSAIEGLDIPLDGDALEALLALRDRLEARISSAVAAHDRAGLWELDGATSMTAWLVDRAAMPRPRAAATTSLARGWTLEKDGKVFRLVAENGTVVAGDWSKPDDGYFGLSLADIAKALEA